MKEPIQKIFKNITINRNVKMATTDPEGNDDDDDNRGITSILTVDDMLITGLSLGGYTVRTKQQIERVKGSTSKRRAVRTNTSLRRISTRLRLLQLSDCNRTESCFLKFHIHIPC